MTPIRHISLILLILIACSVILRGEETKPKPVPVKITAGKTDPAGFIPYWIALEPISISSDESHGKGLDVDYLKGEATTMPVPGDSIAIGGETKHWKTISSDVNSPIVDCEDIAGATLNAVAYLVTYVVLEQDEPAATVTWGTDDGGSLWVNGKECGRFPGGRNCAPDSSVVKDVPLKKGLNVIMLKVLNQYGGSSGVVRLVGSDDKPIAGATILMAPRDKTAPKDAFWYAVDTAQQPLDQPFSAYLAQKNKKP